MKNGWYENTADDDENQIIGWHFYRNDEWLGVVHDPMPSRFGLNGWKYLWLDKYGGHDQANSFEEAKLIVEGRREEAYRLYGPK